MTVEQSQKLMFYRLIIESLCSIFVTDFSFYLLPPIEQDSNIPAYIAMHRSGRYHLSVSAGSQCDDTRDGCLLWACRWNSWISYTCAQKNVARLCLARLVHNRHRQFGILRFYVLERSLNANLQLKQSYSDFIGEYHRLDYMEDVTRFWRN